MTMPPRATIENQANRKASVKTYGFGPIRPM